MRRLLYVPIMHSQADMGAAGGVLARQAAALSGERRWTVHQETLRGFWESVAAFLASFDARRLRLYQDGLAASGQAGRRIVEEAARRGSPNYRLVLDLLDKGAQLQTTEDPALLLRERDNLLGVVHRRAEGEAGHTADSYRRQRDSLTEQRDRFMAAAINGTLREAETGVLFVGAHHDVAAYLDGDITVQHVKDREQVRAYVEELLLGRDDDKLDKLSQVLRAPVAPSGRCPGGP